MKKDMGINLKKVNCPDCGDEQPVFRIPEDVYQFLWGGWICKNCGCKMDKYGKNVD